MGFRVGYRLPCAPQLAKEHPSGARVRRAFAGALEGWAAHAEPTGGCLVTWPNPGGASVPLDQFGEGRPTADGLVYYPSKETPSGEDLIRPERSRPPGTWLELHDGGSLYVPLALATPRKLLITAAGLERGDYATELGRLGHEIFDLFTTKGQGLAEDDPRFVRILQLTLQAAYHVTEEMIADGLPYPLTDQDVNPILMLMFGADPKSLGAEPAPSPSAPVPTPTSP